VERLDELMQKRAALVTETRRVLDKAEGEDRALNAEETQEYERMEGELDGIESRISRLKDTRERQRAIAASEEGVRFRGEGDPAPESGEQERAYRKAFDRYLRHGLADLETEERKLLRDGYKDEGEEVRAQESGTTTKGGYAVPQTMDKRLVQALEQAGTIRQHATVLETAGGGTITIPKVTAHGAASWAAESSTIVDVEETFAEASLGAHKAVKMVKVSIELLEDSGVDIEAYIASEIGRRIGLLENDAYETGGTAQTTKPNGIVNTATVGVTNASATALTADEFLDLIYSVSRPYRPGARFLVADGIVKAVRKLKDADGQYLWSTGLKEGEPDRLFGYPVEIATAMDGAPAANDLVALFGDLSGYFVRDVAGFRIYRLNERFMDAGHIGFLGWHRTDGDLVDTNAVRTMKMAAV